MASPMRTAGASTTRNVPVIATVIGDPGGIGPEVCVKACLSERVSSACRPLLVGNADIVRRTLSALGLKSEVRVIQHPSEIGRRTDGIAVLDPGEYDISAHRLGMPTAAAGHAVVHWIRLAQRLGEDGAIDGLVLGPVDSQSLKLDGEVVDIDALQPQGTYMFRVSGSLRAVPLTEHIPLRAVPATVKKDAVLALIELVSVHLKRWGIPAPRIAVAALNPHAMFEEDLQEIKPAVDAARAAGLDVHGPISPDSVFRMAQEGAYDTVVTMYHDQGQIALKTAAFEGACTIYLGLRYVMLNVPHGTAFDIAPTYTAQSASMASAFATAAALAGRHGFL